MNGVVTISGWALDNTSYVGSAIGSVVVKVDGAVVGNASYGVSRPDVCAAYPGRANCPNVGYSYQLNTNGLATGSHTITVSATDTDTFSGHRFSERDGYYDQCSTAGGHRFSNGGIGAVGDRHYFGMGH